MSLLNQKIRTVLGGEIPLIIWSYGLGIILQPDWQWAAFAPALPVNREVWGCIFIATGLLGYVSLYVAKTKLWRIFLLIGIFLFGSSAAHSWGDWSNFFIYLSLCYCCAARFLEINSSGIVKRGVGKQR
jgi:hypothetical protein